MWSSKLFWKVFLVYAGLNFSLAIGFLVITSAWQRDQVMGQVRVRLHDVAILLHSQVETELQSSDPEALQRLVINLKAKTNLRMTLLDAEGEVLADSDESPEKMENHANRPEVMAAAGSEEIGTAERYSPTVDKPMVYVALPVRDSAGELLGFVRVATETSDVDREIASVQQLFWWLALGIGLLAVLLTYIVVGRIIRPIVKVTEAVEAIAQGETSRTLSAPMGDEVGTLAAAFSQMQQRLESYVQELRVGSERLETVLGGMVEGVLAIDSDERVLLANEASRTLLNFVTEDAVGRPLTEVVRSRILQDSVLQALGEKGPVSAEFEVPGTPRRMIALRAVRLPGNPCPGVVVVLHDMTELRRLENLRREFVANVSHELKTPLSCIKAYAETLRLGGLDDPENNMMFVRRIEEQAERLHQLILDLISLAQVESGREVFEITSVSLEELVDDCVQPRLETAEAKQIELRVEAPEESLYALADEEGVRTILNNLVDNALKYTPDAGSVVVTWRREADQAVLEVRDTGIGIATRDQQRVFERFYRADKARSRELGGTGLGLSIVKHLAQAFGGSVGIESKLGAGSCFQVRLPLAEVPIHEG